MALPLLAAAGGPPVEYHVEYDRAVDFSRYKTWSWGEGVTPALNPVNNRRIRDAIENGLAARGLSRVDGHATLLVVYHASRTTQIDIDPVKYPPPTPTGTHYFQKGSIVVDLLDPASGKVVWRAHASGVLSYGPQEIADQVKAAVDDLMARFPPAADDKPVPSPGVK